MVACGDPALHAGSARPAGRARRLTPAGSGNLARPAAACRDLRDVRFSHRSRALAVASRPHLFPARRAPSCNISRCSREQVYKCSLLLDSRCCANLPMAQFHSGEDLAAKVGLTRARVSQVLKHAGTAGLALERVKGRGYRLLEAPEFLDADEGARRTVGELADGKGPRASAAPSRSSTRSSRRRPSSCAARNAATSTASRSPPNGKRPGAAAAASAWTAIAGGSLTFSLGWRFEQGAGFLAGLSLAVGVAVVRALEAEGFADVELKWPNDLIHRHLKVGGILVELNGDALGPSTVVVGVGLNVRMPAGRPQGHSGAGHAISPPVAGRGAPPDRPQSAARGAARGARGGPRPVRERGFRAVRRRMAAPPRLPGQAGDGCCCPMAPPSPARSPASTRAARWCSPTARAARASCPARSRCAARERRWAAPGASRSLSRRAKRQGGLMRAADAP